MLAIADCSLLCHPLTTSPSPSIMASKPIAATSTGWSFCFYASLVSIRSARSKKSVSVAPGMRQVTVTTVLELGTQPDGTAEQAMAERLGRMLMKQFVAGTTDPERLNCLHLKRVDRSCWSETLCPRSFVSPAQRELIQVRINVVRDRFSPAFAR